MSKQWGGIFPTSNRRNIAAPFQPQKRTNSGRGLSLPEIISNYTVDFRTHEFTPLCPFEDLRYEDYVGPTNESNWVIPGVLLVGAYPASQDDIETFELITSILKLGVRKFVCLQQEYRPGVLEDLWRQGLALRPYFEDVQHIVANKRLIPALRDCDIVDINNLSFDHCPIIDCGITDDSKVLDLARKLVFEISRGEVIYLHCWGGHGRTGTVVSIMLHLMYGLNAFEAMQRCQVVHDLRRCRVEVGSPQTQTQRDQVIRIVNQLIRSYRDNAPNDRVNSPNTRVASPANSLKKVQLRKSPFSSANNSTASLQTVNLDSQLPVDKAVYLGEKEKESQIQPASPVHAVATPTVITPTKPKTPPTAASDQSQNPRIARQKALSLAAENDLSSPPTMLKDTPKTISAATTEVSDMSIDPTASAGSFAQGALGSSDSDDVNTPPVRGVFRQSTNDMNQLLAAEEASASADNAIGPLTKIKSVTRRLVTLKEVSCSIDENDLESAAGESGLLTPMPIVSLAAAGTSLSTAREVINLTTGGSFLLSPPSRQSSGSEAFLSPMMSKDDRKASQEQGDAFYGIRMVPSISIDSNDDLAEKSRGISLYDSHHLSENGIATTSTTVNTLPSVIVPAESDAQQQRPTSATAPSGSRRNSLLAAAAATVASGVPPVDTLRPSGSNARMVVEGFDQHNTSGVTATLSPSGSLKRVVPVPPSGPMTGSARNFGVAHSSGRKIDTSSAISAQH